jgi:hypothetical protein
VSMRYPAEMPRPAGFAALRAVVEGYSLRTIGVVLLSVGAAMLVLSIFLQKRFGHLVAPRPVTLIVLFSVMTVGGLAAILLNE